MWFAFVACIVFLLESATLGRLEIPPLCKMQIVRTSSLWNLVPLSAF